MTGATGVETAPKEDSVEKAATQFILKGFTEVTGFRIFAFEGIAADRTRTAYTVGTDLALTRRYGIRLQELPLLCRAVLEHRLEGEEQRAFTYTEEHMSVYADCAAARAEAAKHRKPSRRPTTDPTATPWRAPAP
jgi:hypothetical protein